MSKTKPAAAYPPAYMTIFMHVLNTNQEVDIDTLGDTEGPYAAMRQNLMMWRKQLSEEGSPVAPQLYGVTISLLLLTPNGWMAAGPEARSLGYSKAKLIIRPTHNKYTQAIEEAAKRLGIPMPKLPEEVMNTDGVRQKMAGQHNEETGASDADGLPEEEDLDGARAISDIFGKDH